MIYLFSDKRYEGVEHLPLFEIHLCPPSFNLSLYDSIIVTSKNSVKALCLSGQAWHKHDIYAIGESTAAAVREEGGNVVFTCKDSYGDVFAHAIAPLLKDKKVFLPRPKEVVSSVFDILQSQGIAITQEVVYETHCKTYPPSYAPPKDAILIFTSPSTVTCFFKNFTWDDSYKVVSIGQKTADALPLHVKSVVSSVQSIEHCIQLAKAI